MRCITQCNAFVQAPEQKCDSLKQTWLTLSGLLALPGSIALSQRRIWTACETTWPRV
jgi:hypothetical protein